MKGVWRLAQKALAMGGAWVRVHPRTGRTLFLKLRIEWEETFAESWSIFKREVV